MGYCGCRRNESPPLSPVVLILSVVAVLVVIPWCFTGEPAVEIETPKLQINWALIVTPILLLAMVHWLSSGGSYYGGQYCPMPPPPYAWCSCRGKYACACANFKYPTSY